MTEPLLVDESVWRTTWVGLQQRGAGERETAAVWLGTLVQGKETVREVIFLDDLPGTVGRRLQHRTSRQAVNMMLARARELDLGIVADIHTHPEEWVGLSEVDRLHPIEYRPGLLALVLPDFAHGEPDLSRTGAHEYLGDGVWRTFDPAEIGRRLVIQRTGAE